MSQAARTMEFAPALDNRSESAREVSWVEFARKAAAIADAYAPKPVPRSSLLNETTVKELGNLMARRRSGLHVTKEEAEMTRNFGLWREKATKVECDNAGNLRVLLRARQVLLKYRDDPELSRDLGTIERVLRERWRIHNPPTFDSTIQLEAFCKKRTTDTNALPSAWRYL